MTRRPLAWAQEFLVRKVNNPIACTVSHNQKRRTSTP